MFRQGPGETAAPVPLRDETNTIQVGTSQGKNSNIEEKDLNITFNMLVVLRASTDSRVTSLDHLSKVGMESWEIAPQTFGNQCHRCFGRSRKRFVVLVHLSLRKLVSGYECGRVFPAGVGPGSPSRDALAAFAIQHVG